MKKLFLFGAAILMAAVSMAQTPTVSTAGIYMRYCTTTNTDVNLTIPSSLVPYEIGGQTITQSGDYPTIYTDQRGCDSIVTIHVTVFDAKFTIADGKQVIFSKGNLQYLASADTWRFALHQYDMQGSKNNDASATYEDWIDVFGFGASGNIVPPYEKSSSEGAYISTNIEGTENEWAWHNKIINGGNTIHTWRVLSSIEWNYMIYYRANASSKYGAATVAGFNGFILLPDTWTTPQGLTFVSGFSSFNNNQYSAADWTKMENAGAIFIPAAGYRAPGTQKMGEVGSWSYYWTSSYINNSQAYFVLIRPSSGFELSQAGVNRAFAVRPVREVQ